MVGKLLRPVLAFLDQRLDATATRLERHTERLAGDQQREVHRIDERLTLDVAVLSEHLVGIDRTARRVADATRPALPERFVLAMPGERLRVPEGVPIVDVAAFAVGDDGIWTRVSVAADSTLRVAVLPASTSA